MRADDEVEVVLAVELLHDVCAEGEGHPPVALRPAPYVGVRVSPEDVTQEARVRHVSRPEDPAYLLHRVEVRAQPAVDAEDLVVHDRRDRQAVEHHIEGLPELERVPPLAFVIKPIDPVDGGALVVPTDHEKVFRVLNLVRQQQADAFEALRAAVHIVPQEEVVGFGREAPILEQAQEVGVLPVDVTDDLERGLELEEHGLRHENLAGLVHKHVNLLLLQRDLGGLAWLVAPDRQQALDAAVHGLLGLCIHGDRHCRSSTPQAPLHHTIRPLCLRSFAAPRNNLGACHQASLSCTPGKRRRLPEGVHSQP
mmetsp:Transcript_67669/g.167193  ORF Transcript_67669/g.167193 Transcript_67669/m.167193 type:complete len:310 (-) Transcript_67669:34-963(-)